MKHGRVPIGDGAVDKAAVLIHSKSVPFKPINPTDYEKVLKENEQLKETNGILIEQINVNHALIMKMYSDFGKEPPPELLGRLGSLDARRQQVVGSPHGCSHSVHDRSNNENTDESDDDDYSESDDNDDGSFEGNGDDDLELEGEDDDGNEAVGGDR